jgi:hypothetical protein
VTEEERRKWEKEKELGSGGGLERKETRKNKEGQRNKGFSEQSDCRSKEAHRRFAKAPIITCDSYF